MTKINEVLKNIHVLKDKVLLIAEDDDNIAYIYEYVFKELFKEVIVTHSGNEAIDVLKTGKVDVLLSDMRMPNGSGIDIAEYLATMTHYPPTVFVTAHAELIGICDDAKCIICHTKPVLMENLIEDMIILVQNRDSEECLHNNLLKALDKHRDKAIDLLNKINGIMEEK